MTTTTNQTTEAINYAGLANKLVAVAEAISTPEQAVRLSYEAFSGVRVAMEEVAGVVLASGDAEQSAAYRIGYKLLAMVSMIETPERASELLHDAWSGFRIMLEEAVEALQNAEALQPVR